MRNSTSKFSNKRNAWAARSVVHVRLIPPGAANTVRFRLRVAEDCRDELRLTAKLNCRKISWWNTQWAYAGERDPSDLDFALGPDYDDGRWLFTGDAKNVSGPLKEIPNLPIVTMAEAEVRLAVVDGGVEGAATVIDPNDALRWNDYGIGLLLQGDLRAAESAFLRVTRRSPTTPTAGSTSLAYGSRKAIRKARGPCSTRPWRSSRSWPRLITSTGSL